MKQEFKIIADLIEKNTRVLDVGCGDGTLMEFLNTNKKVDIRGIEISKNKVQKCIEKGLTVIEGDAEKDLSQFPDSSFDYVILSQTLQAFLDPEKVISELVAILTAYARFEVETNAKKHIILIILDIMLLLLIRLIQRQCLHLVV